MVDAGHLGLPPVLPHVIIDSCRAVIACQCNCCGRVPLSGGDKMQDMWWRIIGTKYWCQLKRILTDNLLDRFKACWHRLWQTVSDNRVAISVVLIIILATGTWAFIVFSGQGTFKFWEWTAQSWQAVGTFAALTGVIGIFFQIQQNAARQRKETGPYVRLDIGPTVEDTMTPFNKPKTYIFLDTGFIDVGGDASTVPRVSISAWLRNYQTHPLGMCFSVSVGFHYRTISPSEETNVGVELWEIAYLEHGHAVQIELFRLPADWSILVDLLYLEYRDFHSQKYLYMVDHSPGIHGRLECLYSPQDGFESTPVALPRR